MFDQGQGCNVYAEPGKVASGKAILTNQNSLNLRQGEKICIRTVSNTLFLIVDRLETINDSRNKDNIVIGVALGVDRKGHYRRVGELAFFLHKLSGTKKVKVSILATALSILSAAAASIAAASKDCHDGLLCIGEMNPISWFLIGLSAFASIVAWCKDNEIF